MRAVTWYLTGSPNPYVDAVEPGAAGVTIPGSVLDWASRLGLDESDPDVYLLVTTGDQPGEVIGLMGALEGDVTDEDGLKVDQALELLHAERAERR